MIDVVVKMTPEELRTLMSVSSRMGKYNKLIYMQDGTLTEIDADGGGVVGKVEEGSEDTGELLAAMYTAFARTFGNYPDNPCISAVKVAEQ